MLGVGDRAMRVVLERVSVLADVLYHVEDRRAVVCLIQASKYQPSLERLKSDHTGRPCRLKNISTQFFYHVRLFSYPLSYRLTGFRFSPLAVYSEIHHRRRHWTASVHAV